MTSLSKLKRSMIVARLIIALAVAASAPCAVFAQFGVIFGDDGRAAENQFSRLSLSSEGIVAATDRDAKCVRLWDVEEGPLRRKLDGFTGSVQTLSFSEDGKTLAIGDQEKVISLFDTESGQRTKTLNGHRSKVSCLAFSPGGKTLASGNDEGEFFLWNIETGEMIHRFPQPTGWMNAFAFLPDGETLLASFSEKQLDEEASSGVQFWNLKSGERTANLRLVPFRPRWVAASSDGKLMAYSSRGLVLLWDVSTRTLLRALVCEGNDWIDQIAFSPDGRHLTAVTHQSGDVVRVWDVTTTRQVWRRDFKNPVLHLSFTRDGSTLVSADRESLRLYDFESTTLRREWFPQGDALRDHDPKVVGAKP